MLPLSDNALFMQNWRERMRPATVISAVILTIIILVLTFLASYIKYSDSDHINPYLKAFWGIAVAQGILLLLIGSASANNMAARERSGGTLDFHRASPTTRFDQILGILLGAPSLEWCIFLSTLPISFGVAVLGDLGWQRALEFYVAMVLCAVFFHILCIFIGLYYDRKQGHVFKRGGIIQTFVFFYFILGGLAYMSNNFSSLKHLTCLPQYWRLSKSIFKIEHYYYSDYYHNTEYLNYTFYNVQLPSLLLQTIVQLPLILFLWIATARKISRLEHPVFSKTQSLLSIAFILFLYIGSAISIFLDGSVYEYQTASIKTGFLYFLMILGFLGTLGATPTQLLFIKGLRKVRKLDFKKIGWDKDYSSNRVWLLVFSMIALVAYKTLSPWIAPDFEYRALLFVNLILYVLSFAWALEYFRLSQHHKKQMLFIVVLSIFWVFIPILGSILTLLKSNPDLIHYFLAPSPFSGLGDAINIVDGTAYTNRYQQQNHLILYINLTINSIIALVTLILANLEQSRIKKNALAT